jgi:drug/metabolite transporter (DMT)-like permease
MDKSILALTLFGSFLWGISPIVTKLLIAKYNHYTIMLLCAFIYFICLLMGLPYYNKQLMKDIGRLTNKDIGLFLFEGIFVLFLANVVYYYVIKDNDSFIVTALQSCGPLFTLIFAYYLLHEKVNLFGFIGVLLIVLGVICISYNDTEITLFETFLNRP